MRVLATEPVEAPSAGREVLLTGTGSDATQIDQSLTGGKNTHFTGGSESDEDLQSEPGSPVDGNPQGELPDRDDTAEQDLSEEANYRETIRGVKSFMGWHQIPDC